MSILDPDNFRARVDLSSSRETLADIAGRHDSNSSPDELGNLRRQMRRVAEVQTGIRLLVMNAMMVPVWSGSEGAWRSLVPDVIECLRLVMQQPALAEVHLEAIKDKLQARQEDRGAATE